MCKVLAFCVSNIFVFSTNDPLAVCQDCCEGLKAPKTPRKVVQSPSTISIAPANITDVGEMEGGDRFLGRRYLSNLLWIAVSASSDSFSDPSLIESTSPWFKLLDSFWDCFCLAYFVVYLICLGYSQTVCRWITATEYSLIWRMLDLLGFPGLALYLILGKTAVKGLATAMSGNVSACSMKLMICFWRVNILQQIL